jgi:hypothetical protein
MTNHPETVPQLTEVHHALLSEIYRVSREHGNPPTYQYLDKFLDQRFETTLEGELADLPGLLRDRDYTTSNGRRQRGLGLTIDGAIALPEAEADAHLFLLVVSYLVDRERHFVPPDPTSNEQLQVTKDDIQRMAAIRAWTPDVTQVDRVLPFVEDDPNLWNGLTGGPDWVIHVSERIRRYRGVQTLQDYVARRDPHRQAIVATAFPAQVALARPATANPIPAVPPAIPQPTGVEPELEGAPPPAPERRTAFILMDFDPTFDAVHEVIQRACAGSAIAGLQSLRADEITKSGRITEQIQQAIRDADIIIADISGPNSNVMYELGFADALQKSVILLNREGSEAPFDIAHLRYIGYPVAEPNRAYYRLVSFLKTMIA